MSLFGAFISAKEITIIFIIIGLSVCGCKQNNIVDTLPIEQVLIRQIDVSELKKEKKDGAAEVAVSL